MNKLSFLPYNQGNILNKLKKLKIEQESNGKIITKLGDDLLCTSQRSLRYGIFQFGEFIENILPSVENIFHPNNYILNLSGGYQELKMTSGNLKLNLGDTTKMISIISSSNGQKALQIIAGIVRLACTNGMVVSEKDQSTSIYTKHYNTTLPQKIQYFEEQLQKLPLYIDKQIELINQIDDKKISLVELAKKLIINDKIDVGNNIKPSGLIKFHCLIEKLKHSETDRLNLTDLTSEQRNFLYTAQPIDYLDGSVDIEIPKNQIFNCYTEIYRNATTDIIRKETSRIYKLIN